MCWATEDMWSICALERGLFSPGHDSCPQDHNDLLVCCRKLSRPCNDVPATFSLVCFRWRLMCNRILLRSTELRLWVSATWRHWLWRACPRTAQMSCACPTCPSTRPVVQPLHCATCQTSRTGQAASLPYVHSLLHLCLTHTMQVGDS